MQISAQIALILWLFVAAMRPVVCSRAGDIAYPACACIRFTLPILTARPRRSVSRSRALLADPSVSRAHWGIAVTTLDGTPLYGHDEGKLFRPASNNKIFTTATAMALLGPDKTFDTRIFGKLDACHRHSDGRPDAGRRRGRELRCRRSALCAALGANAAEPPAPPQPPALADLTALVDQLVAKGVKRINGDIVGDDTLYPYEPYAESWAQDDQVWGYRRSGQRAQHRQQSARAHCHARVHPDQGSAQRAAEQNVPYYTVESQVETVAAGAHADGIQIERLPGSRVIRVYGSIAADAHPDVEELAIADPAEYAAMALRAMLVQRGIVVTGKVRAKHQRPNDAKKLPHRGAAARPMRCHEHRRRHLHG